MKCWALRLRTVGARHVVTSGAGQPRTLDRDSHQEGLCWGLRAGWALGVVAPAHPGPLASGFGRESRGQLAPGAAGTGHRAQTFPPSRGSHAQGLPVSSCCSTTRSARSPGCQGEGSHGLSERQGLWRRGVPRRRCGHGQTARGCREGSQRCLWSLGLAGECGLAHLAVLPLPVLSASLQLHRGQK